MATAAAQVQHTSGRAATQLRLNLGEVVSAAVVEAGDVALCARRVLFGDKRMLGRAHGWLLLTGAILPLLLAWYKMGGYPGMTASTMPETTDQRRELGGFLRTRREAVSPSQAGLLLGARARRRTPGLRREEVAQLCGISTTWYTWIEQGRDITLSAAALARLADALRLTAAERAYLFELTRRRDPTPPVAPSAPVIVAAALRAVLEVIETPAYLLDRQWHVRAWNDAAGDLFAPWLDSDEPCMLRFVFLKPAAREFICDWNDRAQPRGRRRAAGRQRPASRLHGVHSDVEQPRRPGTGRRRAQLQPSNARLAAV